MHKPSQISKAKLCIHTKQGFKTLKKIKDSCGWL